MATTDTTMPALGSTPAGTTTPVGAYSSPNGVMPIPSATNAPAVVSSTAVTDKVIPNLNQKMASVAPASSPTTQQQQDVANGSHNPSGYNASGNRIADPNAVPSPYSVGSNFAKTHDMNNAANKAAYAQSPEANPMQGNTAGQMYVKDATGAMALNPNFDPTQDPSYIAHAKMLDDMQAATDANTAAQIANIKQQFEARKAQIQQIASSQQDSRNQSLLMGGGARYSLGDVGIIPAMSAQMVSDIAAIDSQEQSAILQAQAAQSQNDFKTMQEKLSLSDELYQKKQDALAKLSDQTMKDNQALKEKQKIATQSANITAQFADGTTNPADIFAKLRANGDTTTTMKDITDTIANLNPDQKAIRDIMTSVAENGAPQSVKDAVAGAKTFNDAIKAAGIYLQKGTGDVGAWISDNQYLAAQGKPQISMDDYMAKKNELALQLKTKEAYATAKATEQGKAAGAPSSSSITGLPQGFANAVNSGKTGTDLLGSLASTDKATVQSILDYKKNPANLSLRKSAGEAVSEREKYLAMAHSIDPNYDESQYNARSKYNASIQSGTIYQGLQAAGKSINHMTALLDSMDKMDNGTVSDIANKYGTMVEKPFSQKLQQNAKTAGIEATGVSQELAKFFKGTGVSDTSSIKEWENNLNINATPAEQAGIKEGALKLLTGQLDVVYDQYRNTMGKEPDHPLVPMEALNHLKDMGVDISNYIPAPTLSSVGAAIDGARDQNDPLGLNPKQAVSSGNNPLGI